MRCLLVNPPFKPEHGRFSRAQRSPAITKSGTLYFPMWLCYAAGVLEAHGYEVRILDAPATNLSLDGVCERAAAFDPRLIVVDTSTPSIYNDVQVAARLKAIGEAFVVLVGTHPSALPEETLRLSDRVDAVALREYEYTLCDLAGVLRECGPRPDRTVLAGIAGLCWRVGAEVIHNPHRPFIADLDSLPFVSNVYRRHLRVHDYFYAIAQYPQVAIFSGRGCVYRCSYCVYPEVMHGHAYRKRSVANLVAEFAYVEKELPEVREIFIEDDTFTVDEQRARAFSRAYREAGLHISWIANSRANIDAETLKALRACNCRLLCVGFESGDQGVLDAIGKKLNLDRARRFAREAADAGILIHGCFMVGCPGETVETMEATLQYAKDLSPDSAQFFPIMVYPGTRAYDWARQAGHIVTEDFSRWNTETGMHCCVVSRPGLTNTDLMDFCDRARREFYLRPRYIAHRLARLLTHPAEDASRVWKSAKIFWKFLMPGTPGTVCPQPDRRRQ